MAEGIVVMEDLELKGGEFGQSLQHIGVDGVARALEGLARLHGAWWASPKLDSQPWLPSSMQTPVDSDQLEIMWEYAQTNMADPAFRKVISQWVLDDPQRFVRAYKALDRFERSQTGPRCVVHGDCHLGNSYRRADGERIWLDWQLVRKGRPWRDLTYFMIGSLTIEERRQSERALHKHYRDALVATGRAGRRRARRDLRELPPLDHLRAAGLDCQHGPLGAERSSDERALLHGGRRSGDPEGAGKLAPYFRTKAGAHERQVRHRHCGRRPQRTGSRLLSRQGGPQSMRGRAQREGRRRGHDARVHAARL